MLNLVWLTRQAYQKTLWDQFNPKTQTWIVSDRKTKFFLTQSLLNHYEIISDPVMRAKEFYRELLRVADPEMKILEDLGTRVQAKDFLLTDGKSEWCSRPNAPQKLIDACENLASLLTHELSGEYLAEIGRDFKRGSGPFLELAELGEKFYRRCLENKRLPRFFLPYFLAQHDGDLLSGRQLLFDLSFDLKEGERDLIQRLSRTNEIKVLIPARDRETLEETGLYAYRNFDLGVAQVKEEVLGSSIQHEIKTQTSLWRCSSPEAEARKAVEQVSLWIAQGIKPTEICIAADRFSNYENILSHDLDWEGIGLHRKIQTVLSASRVFRALSARLLIVKGNLQASIIEEAFLSVAVYKKTVRRRQERRVLNPILHENQIPHPKLRADIQELRKKKQKRMTVAKFEDLVIDIFKDLVKEVSSHEDPMDAEDRSRLFLTALGKLRTEVGDQDLELNQWIEAWQEVTNTVRLAVKQPVENGVWGVDLSSIEEVPASHLIILGAVESSSRHSIVSGLGEDKLKYLKEKGFDLSFSSRKKVDPLMQWILTGQRKEIVLSSPKTDSAGQSVAANPLWLRLAAKVGKDLERLDFAHATVWVDVQKSILNPEVAAQVDQFKNWEPGTTSQTAALVSEELAGTKIIQLPEQEGSPLSLSLSASKIESYWKCPYKFFASSYLKLYDEEDLEVEPSFQKQGQWLHSAVEKIMLDPRPLDSWNEEALLTLVDSLDEIQKQVSSDIWGSIRSRFVRKVAGFVKAEMEWRKTQTRAKPVGLEAQVRGYLEWAKDKPFIRFSQTKSPTGEYFSAPFSGKIDRIDETADGRALIIDYKSGSGAASNIPTWAENGVFQLALYSEAVEAGLQENRPRKVIAAQYYTLRRYERDRGFKIIDEDLNGILPQGGPRDAAITNEGRAKSFSEINSQVHGVLEKIRIGTMTPLPETEKTCTKCSWRTSCRAAHLS